MDVISLLVVWTCWTFFKFEILSQEEETAVAISAPINPVREEAMISIHCQVRNKAEGQEITMSRRVAGALTSERLSWEDQVQKSDDDRIFLAKRRLSDGSIVYFLSIIDITKADEGLYFCKVISNANDRLAEIASASVNLEVHYFPTENPVCELQSPESLEVQSGSNVQLMCTAEKGFPTVDLEWSRTASSFNDKGIQTIENGRIVSVLSMQLYTSDRQAVFLCKLTSPAFPNVLKTCHTGPFRVTPNPYINEPEIVKPKTDDPREPEGNIPMPSPNNEPTIVLTKPEDCDELCSPLSGHVIYWMIGTIVAGVLAMVFVIIGILFALKLSRLQSVTRRRAAMRPVQRQVSDDLYERLECRPDGNPRVYMSLDRLKKPGVLVVKESRAIDRDYTGTPTAPSM